MIYPTSTYISDLSKLKSTFINIYQRLLLLGIHPTKTSGDVIEVGQGDEECTEDYCMVGGTLKCISAKDDRDGVCCNIPEDENDVDGKASVI